MIKFILSDDEQYSYKYAVTLPIKEILNDFCIKRGLLPDIYEAYDPVRLKALDTSKSLHDYKLDSLHLKRVDSSMSSHDKLSNDNEKLWNIQSIRTYSQNSYTQTILNKENAEKKHKNGLISKLRNRFTNKKHHIDRSYSESVVPHLENQLFALSTSDLHDDAFQEEPPKKDIGIRRNKKKRVAPPPPLAPRNDNITLYIDDITLNIDNITHSKPTTFLELEIPPPPSYLADIPGIIHYFPWQHHIECCTNDDDFGDDSVYSTISTDPFPLTVSEHNIIETPIFRQISDSIDDPGYIYATIQKTAIPLDKEDSDNSSIDSPKHYFKSTNIVPVKRPRLKFEKRYDEVNVPKVTAIGFPHVDAQLQCPNISPKLKHTKESVISARKTFFNPPIICAKSNQSPICFTGSDEPFDKDQTLPIANPASTSQGSFKEPTEELKISAEDQLLKIQDLNIEQNLPESKRTLELTVKSDGQTSTEKENVHLIAHISKSHLPVDHVADQVLPYQKNQVTETFQKSHISDSSANANHLIVQQKLKSEDSTNEVIEKQNLDPPIPPPKPKNYIVEHRPRDRIVKIERQGKSLFFKL